MFKFRIRKKLFWTYILCRNYSRLKKSLLTVRYLKADEFRFNPGSADYDEPSLHLKEFGILFGKYYKQEELLLSLATGFGFLSGTDRGQKITEDAYEKITLSTFCFPWEASFRIEITKRFGVGGLCFGNVNSKRSYFGGIINISIGSYNLQ